MRDYADARLETWHDEIGSMKVSRLTVIGAVCICALVLAATAAAGSSPLVKTYGGQAVNALTQVKPKQPKPTASAPVQKGTLPFTGQDLGVVGGVAIVLLAGGAALRRIGRSKN